MNAADRRLQDAMTNAAVNNQPMGIDLTNGDVYMDNSGGIRRHGESRSIDAGSLVAKQDTKLALVITSNRPNSADESTPAPLSIDNHGRIVANGTAEPHNARASSQSIPNGHVVAHMDTKLA